MVEQLACVLYPNDLSTKTVANFINSTIMSDTQVTFIFYDINWPEVRQLDYVCVLNDQKIFRKGSYP